MKLRKLMVAVFAFFAGLAQAQQMPPIPADPDVVVGKLDNGLTYYIRHNNWPEKLLRHRTAARRSEPARHTGNARTRKHRYNADLHAHRHNNSAQRNTQPPPKKHEKHMNVAKNDAYFLKIINV